MVSEEKNTRNCSKDYVDELYGAPDINFATLSLQDVFGMNSTQGLNRAVFGATLLDEYKTKGGTLKKQVDAFLNTTSGCPPPEKMLVIVLIGANDLKNAFLNAETGVAFQLLKGAVFNWAVIEHTLKNQLKTLGHHLQKCNVFTDLILMNLPDLSQAPFITRRHWFIRHFITYFLSSIQLQWNAIFERVLNDLRLEKNVFNTTFLFDFYDYSKLLNENIPRELDAYRTKTCLTEPPNTPCRIDKQCIFGDEGHVTSFFSQRFSHFFNAALLDLYTL